METPSESSDSSQPDPSASQRLHAYWRMPYILASKGERKSDNPFIEIAQSNDDAADYILKRGAHTFIVMNRYPYNAGHLLIVPNREVAALEGLRPPERYELMDMIIEAQSILTRALQPDGFNTGFNFGQAGGAGIPKHLHCHVVPRWAGDTNFMPVISNTRVIPDAMDAMWSRLREHADS